MTSVPKNKKVSREEFLIYQDSIERKAEYLDGEIYDMSGGTGRHAMICGNLTIVIGSAVRGKGCTVFPADLMYHIPLSGGLFIPDFSVICGTTEYENNREDIAKNPILIVEVLSKSTAEYCRNGKFTGYSSIPTLNEYLLVDQYSHTVEVRIRRPFGTWEVQTFASMEDQIALQSLGIKISMHDIYYGVVFP